MSFGNNPLFSIGAEQAIVLLLGKSRGEGRTQFPPRWDKETDVKIGATESPAAWFRRVVGTEEGVSRRVEDLAINDRFALIGVVRWKHGALSFSRLHAVVVENATLSSLLGDNLPENLRAWYYRLDFDLTKPGPLFSEPQPHIHCVPEGAPRFPLPGSDDESVPLRFIEFIFLNHFHSDWLKWVRDEVIDPDFPFDSIVGGFEDGAIHVRLQELEPYLDQLRTLLATAKQRICGGGPTVERRLSYIG